MTTITLEEIKAKKDKLVQMIAALQAAPQPEPTVYTLPAAEVYLKPGEHYAGLVLDATTGQPSHYLVLLAGDAGELTWAEATAWAEEHGGHLPTRQEQALLFANFKREFEGERYWSGEKSSSGSAWLQYFYDGNQGSDYLLNRLRVRAVLWADYVPPKPAVTRPDAFAHEQAMSRRGDALVVHAKPLGMCVGKLVDSRSHIAATLGA